MGAPRDEEGRQSARAGRAPIRLAYGGKSFDARARAASSPGLMDREIVEVFDTESGQLVGFAIVTDGTRVAGVGRRTSHVSEADVRAIVEAFLLARSCKVSTRRRRIKVVGSDLPRLLRELADVIEDAGVSGAPPETLERIVRAVIPVVDQETATHLRERLSLLHAAPTDEEAPTTKRQR